MEQIIRVYGKFLLDAAAVVLLLLMLCLGIVDDAGNRGIFQIVGAYVMSTEKAENQAGDFLVYQQESGKKPPSITCTSAEALQVGRQVVTEYIKAVDGNGQEIPVRILEIRDMYGECLETCNLDTCEVDFKEPGIYTVRASAVDAGNRRCVCQINLPVND